MYYVLGLPRKSHVTQQKDKYNRHFNTCIYIYTYRFTYLTQIFILFSFQRPNISKIDGT